MSVSRLFPALLLAAVVATLPASAETLKTWRHGILEAKSDSGFIMMAERGGFAAKRGLKIETSQMKAGATVIKALVAGELDSVEMGAACRRSSWPRPRSSRRPTSRAALSRSRSRARCPTC
jgi:ABC-type nitrate/sulfonate/bicarbonate transport system substrate-binding protein